MEKEEEGVVEEREEGVEEEEEEDLARMEGFMEGGDRIGSEARGGGGIWIKCRRQMVGLESLKAG